MVEWKLAQMQPTDSQSRGFGAENSPLSHGTHLFETLFWTMFLGENVSKLTVICSSIFIAQPSSKFLVSGLFLKMIDDPKELLKCRLYLSIFIVLEIQTDKYFQHLLMNSFKITIINHYINISNIFFRENNCTFQNKKRRRRIPLFYIFMNLFNACFKSRELDSRMCFCIKYNEWFACNITGRAAFKRCHLCTWDSDIYKSE